MATNATVVLLNELVSDPSLMTRFDADRNAFLAEQDIPQAERAALSTLDLEGLVKAARVNGASTGIANPAGIGNPGGISNPTLGIANPHDEDEGPHHGVSYPT